MALLSPFTNRADITAASATTVQFAASTQLVVRPIKIGALSGRIASLQALPSAVTISGPAGTYYIYAALGAPSGSAYATLLGLIGGGLLQNLLANIVATLQVLFSGDGTHGLAGILSAVTLVADVNASPPNTHHVALGSVEWDGSAIVSFTSYENQVSITVSSLIHGQCELVKSGADLKLQTRDGTSLVINGAARSVPVAGVTLAPTSLTPDTTYYIYAAWSGSAVTLEASTTAYATHTDGVKIKSGDATRTLVGLARIITGPAWVDTDAQRFVRSWFHDGGVAARRTLTADRSQTSTSFIELHSELQIDVLMWANEYASMAFSGFMTSGNFNADARVGLSVDSTTVPEPGIQIGLAGARVAMPRGTLAEGLHTFRVLVKRVTAGTAEWEGTTSPERAAHSVTVVR